jgi:hypothetical protein
MNLVIPFLALCFGILPSYEAARRNANSSIITIHHGNPDDFVNVLQQVYQDKLIVRSLPQTGRILIDADPKLTTEVKELVKMLDVKPVNPTPATVIRIPRPPVRRGP